MNSILKIKNLNKVNLEKIDFFNNLDFRYKPSSVFILIFSSKNKDEILFLKDRLNHELADRTGQPLDKIQTDTDRDFFMSPQQAMEYGLIDNVIDKSPVRSV